MMRTVLRTALIMMLSTFLVIAGCGQGGQPTAKNGGNNETGQQPKDNGDGKDSGENQPEVSQLTGEIDVWCFGGWLKPPEDEKSWFQKQYPNIKVNHSVMGWGEMHKKVLTTLAAGRGAPDVFCLEQGWLDEFNNISGIANLLEEPFNAGQYKEDFVPGIWERNLSLDGNALLGLTSDGPPAVWFYRQDIYANMGFPTKPKAVGKFMENPENVLAMAQALKQRDKYIFQYSNDPVSKMWSWANPNFFNRKLEFVRNNDKWAKAIDISQQIAQLDLTLGTHIWGDEGHQAMNAGRLVSFGSGPWYLGNLQKWAKDTEDKWRITRLPFNKYGGNGGTSYAITEQSKNKKAAWAYLKTLIVDTDKIRAEWQERKEELKAGEEVGVWTSSAFKPVWDLPGFMTQKSPWLGDQQINQVIVPMIERIPLQINTPLDDKANEIWNKVINDAIGNGTDPKAALNQAESDIMDAVKSKREGVLLTIQGE